jgi:thioesterase domain-containing protein/acyl carrier protein
MGVEQAVVLMREYGGGDGEPVDKRLVAYVVGKKGVPLDGQELRGYLRARLPEYMLPGGYVILDELPLTPNGKVDRQALGEARMQRGDGDGKPVGPRNELEEQLCRLWEEVLGVQSVGVRDNFFDLGGHSLLAVRLFSQIEASLGKRLPLALLFQAPTVAELAVRLQESEVFNEWSAVVPIQGQGARPPFFCVHNFGGEVLNYEPLAQALGAEQPFYGLQAIGLDGSEEPHRTIPEMAAYYLHAVRGLQPHGPYYLGGFCFGGVVAYEMACQLEAQGEEVALLAVISSSPPIPSPGWTFRKIAHLLGNFPYWLRDYATLERVEIMRTVRRRLRVTAKRFSARLGKPVDVKPLDLIGEQISNIADHRQKLMEIHLQALMDYTPSLYKGHVTLFRVRAFPLFTYYDPDMGWGRVTSGGVTVRIIQGTHYDALERQHADFLARELGASLEQAREQRSIMR